MNFIARGIFSIDISIFLILAELGCLHTNFCVGKTRRVLGVLVPLILGLSHENDIWKKDASSQGWDRIVLRDIHGGTVGPKINENNTIIYKQKTACT